MRMKESRRVPDRLRNCHPERSEGPAVPASEETADASPDPSAPDATPAPETPMERMMTQWAQRVHSLYNRKH